MTANPFSDFTAMNTHPASHTPSPPPPEIPVTPHPQPDIEPSPAPEPEIPQVPEEPGTPDWPTEPDIVPEPALPEMPPPGDAGAGRRADKRSAFRNGSLCGNDEAALVVSQAELISSAPFARATGALR